MVDWQNKYLNKIVQGDCLELMKEIPDESIDLILQDPPYNIGKAEWDKIDNYVEWCGKWIIECQRILKDNGSFYLFHNDMTQISPLMEWIKQNTNFIFKQMLVWNKRFEGAKNKGYLDGFIETNLLRNYQKMVEYILFYIFQDETGLITIKTDMNNFTTLRQYFKDFQNVLGLSLCAINHKLGHRKAEHSFYWGSSQWDMPTKETYTELCKLPLLYKFSRREYEDLRREYEDLRREYEDLRYTFNNHKTHHSVWNYNIENKLHIAQKPVALIENIIKHSSNEGNTVFDGFIGSGTTALAAIRTNRNFIGMEISPEYCGITEKRIERELQQLKLEL